MSDLLTLDDIARMWQIKREHARRYLTKLPEFPAPVPGSTRKHRLWRPEDVRAFIEREQIPA